MCQPACLFCDSPAKIVRNKDGSISVVRKTCGSEACLNKSRAVNAVLANAADKKEKACNHCSKWFKPVSARQVWCKDCVPDKQNRRRMQKYNLSQEMFMKMYNEQGGKCKLCPNPIEVVDHCHETGVVRGLLCNRCNINISLLERDIEFLKQAIIYTGKSDAFQIKSPNALDVRKPPRDGSSLGGSHERYESFAREEKQRKRERSGFKR